MVFNKLCYLVARILAIYCRVIVLENILLGNFIGCIDILVISKYIIKNITSLQLHSRVVVVV
jgi:hypothetical protein